MRTLLLALLLPGLALATEPSANRYREGQPEVLAQREPQALVSDAQLAEFRSRYEAAGRPRVLLLWGQGLEASTERRELNAQVQGFDAQRGPHFQQFSLSWLGRAAAPAASLLAPAARARYESALHELLLSAGVRLVDRELAVRKTALTLTRDPDAPTAIRTEAPLLEAQALSDLAEVLLHVQWIADPQSPGGWLARLTLREMATGATLADSLQRGSDRPRSLLGGRTTQPNEQRAWQATAQGFERIAQPVDEASLAQLDGWRLMQRWPANR